MKRNISSILIFAMVLSLIFSATAYGYQDDQSDDSESNNSNAEVEYNNDNFEGLWTSGEFIGYAKQRPVPMYDGDEIGLRFYSPTELRFMALGSNFSTRQIVSVDIDPETGKGDFVGEADFRRENAAIQGIIALSPDLVTIHVEYEGDQYPAQDLTYKKIWYDPDISLVMPASPYSIVNDLPDYSEYTGFWIEGGNAGDAANPWYESMLSINFIDRYYIIFCFEKYRVTGTDMPIHAVFDPKTGVATFFIDDTYKYIDQDMYQRFGDDTILESSMKGVSGRIILKDGHASIIFDDNGDNSRDHTKWGLITFDKYSNDINAIDINRAG